MSQKSTLLRRKCKSNLDSVSRNQEAAHVLVCIVGMQTASMPIALIMWLYLIFPVVVDTQKQENLSCGRVQKLAPQAPPGPLHRTAVEDHRYHARIISNN